MTSCVGLSKEVSSEELRRGLVGVRIIGPAERYLFNHQSFCPSSETFIILSVKEWGVGRALTEDSCREWSAAHLTGCTISLCKPSDIFFLRMEYAQSDDTFLFVAMKPVACTNGKGLFVLSQWNSTPYITFAYTEERVFTDDQFLIFSLSLVK